MISNKQKHILAFPHSSFDAIICDGAVRSGKTSLMTVAFVDWAMEHFSGQRFGICGKTVDSATKNIIVPYLSMAYAKKRYTLRWRRSDKLLEVSRGGIRNTFEVFGGKDESSFALIQGRTLAGVFVDEVALQPQSFVEQALARCSVDGSKFWFSCNPGSPNHWFYQNWIRKHRERNALYLRFQLEDNPGLTEAIIARYKSLYTGVFYQRYIQGLWVVAEGLVYPMFGESCLADGDRQYERYVVSMDYGIQNPTAMLLWGLCGGAWYQVDEYYHSGRESNEQKTDQEYYEALCKLVGDKQVRELIIDPSASSFIALVNKRHRFLVRKANNEVIDGIQHTASCLQDGKLKVCRSCKHTIAEYGLYSWDSKADRDAVIKANDHAMDATRYFVNTMGIWREKTRYIPLYAR